MKLSLDNETSLFYEKEVLNGVRIVIDYTALWNEKRFDILGNMFLQLINIKSDCSGYNENNIVSIETYYDTNKIEIVFGVEEAHAKSILSQCNYYLNDKKTLSFKISSIENRKVYLLYGENEDFEEVSILVKNC